MPRSRILLIVAGALVLAIGAYLITRRHSGPLVLTGIVTTNDVIVSPQVEGRVSRLLVREGDTVVPGQLVAVLAPAELAAERTYYSSTMEALSAEVVAGAADLQAAIAQDSEAMATVANAKRDLERSEALQNGGGIAAQEVDAARTSYQVARARSAAASQQVALKRSMLAAGRRQQSAAAAQRTRADVRLGYSEIHAPIAGIVDVGAVRSGEVVTSGQPILTLINPDDLWVRVDVEETYISRIRLGDRLSVRLPGGDVRVGIVFYRGVDAGFATQRDVSRTKRDIKTFEVRLRVDNSDRRLAVGMTAYVVLPVEGPRS
jgi:HlyD family secretion protein